MVKLYPPIISGTLPAFYLENSNLDRIIKITVPFTMNRAVSAAQIKGFALKIKTVQNSEYLYTAQTFDKVQFNLEGSSYVNFILKTSNNSNERELLLKTLKVGLFYKIQIAYIDQNGDIGNFSTVGISKYTTKPKVEIKGLNINTTNAHIYNYIGVYDQEDGDVTEKVHTYRFDIYDYNDNIIATSGDKIHNTTLDTELNYSYDKFDYVQDFEVYKPYKIQYTIFTNNNLEIQSPLYRISQKVTINSDLKADIVVTPNFSDGFIDVDLIGYKNSKNTETITTGSFILSRSSEDSDYKNWEKLSTFKLIAELPSRHLWRDFTAEQGKKYKYSIQQYNDDGLYSNRLLSNEVFLDFEDTFLYDGVRQLKIRYNPKVGSIRTYNSESKVETLGSKYPYFFQNSKINYKELPISGLLSYLGDDNFFFISKEELMLPEEIHRHRTPSSHNIEDPVAENIARERLFKNKVLDWLNDGKPKLLRTPHEGNFIVRLTRVMLNPEHKLGRLLHSFNGTAYEVDEYNYENLIKYNFTTILDNHDIKFSSWKTIEFVTKDENGNIIYPINTVLNQYPTNNIKILGMRAGQKISLTFENNVTEIIVIGVTGSYSLNSDIKIREIKLLESNLTYTNGTPDPYLTGSLTYSFIETTPNTFNKIAGIQNNSYPVRQFIGEYSDILKEITCVKYNNVWLKNPKEEVLEIFKVKCKKRDIDKVVLKDGIFYQENTNIEYDLNYANRSGLILVGKYERISPYYNKTRADWTFIPLYYYDTFHNKEISLEEYNPTININNNIINVEDDVLNFEVSLKELTTLSCNNGAILEISYYTKFTDYRIEDNPSYPDVYNAKLQYNIAKNKLDRYYEITGILGAYEGSWKQTQSYLNTLEEQLTADKNIEIGIYDAKQEALRTNYQILLEQHNIAHNNAVEYLTTKIEELKANPLNTEKYWNEVEQYEQALYVENYEYERQSKIRENELNKQLASLDAKISIIETEFAKEMQSIREQAIVQLATVTQNKQSVLAEIKSIYGIENIDENMDIWYSLRDNLVQEEKMAYAAFINGLIISQQIESEEEQFND